MLVSRFFFFLSLHNFAPLIPIKQILTSLSVMRCIDYLAQYLL